MHADVAGRVLLTVDVDTAHELARALLRMDAGEPVEDEDLVDAFGEVANVVGGNLKALLPVQGTLTLPRVDRTAPSHPGATVVDRVPLAWRGRSLDIGVWQI
jgi:CheY-specific phosphatase CheX